MRTMGKLEDTFVEKALNTDISIDLHGYHPNTVHDLVLKLVRQSHEMGLIRLTLIHGHALNRPISRPFANTNTGYLGLTVRSILRNESSLRQWMYAKIDVSDPGVTKITLKPNPEPSRTDFEPLPDRDFNR